MATSWRAIPWEYDDGGAKAAGYKGDAGDCVIRAAAIATGRPYAEVRQVLLGITAHERDRKRRSTPRGGVYTLTTRRLFYALQWEWVPVMGIGTGCRMHLKTGELPRIKRLVASVSKHVTAVVDGTLRDTYDSSRNGTRCVYGYWMPCCACGGKRTDCARCAERKRP